VNELDCFNRKIEDIVEDFNSRVRVTTIDLDVNVKMQNNARVWFVQSLNTLVDELIEKFKDWQFNAQKNIDN
jgi:hypothetical protein